MTNTPSTETLALLKQYGQVACRTLSQVQAQVQSLLSQAEVAARQATSPESDTSTALLAANETASLCAATVYACHGFAPLPLATFSTAEALTLLAAELQLSILTLEPLQQLRHLVLTAGTPDADPFLSFQAQALTGSLLTWTRDFAANALPA